MSVREKGDGTELIAMLTYNDRTVPDAPEIFEICKDLFLILCIRWNFLHRYTEAYSLKVVCLLRTRARGRA